jgi:branched-chain amino acid aminotransferase
MDVCFGKYFILNGYLKPSDAFDNSLVYEGDSIYEVIRMVDGRPLFFHEHLERLENSVKLQQRDMLAGSDVLRRDIIRLTGSESTKEANLKIVFNYSCGLSNYLVYFIEPTYPTQDQYNNGIKGILFSAERKDPASKIINTRLRSDIYHKLILEGAYEALLVDHNNCITEGSRSNIFFIKKGTLYTAPDNIILSGITRKYILAICHEHKISVIFECVRVDKIGEFDSVFMSGTSPMVLPFSSIENTFFDVKLPLLRELRQLYLQKAQESTSRFRSE